ncbi:MAG TPA: LamG-like jellyroll fold domain-containing protein [Chthoniobacteraceae bacterium]|nr:LamG-like jellyroll fold domain-containing protein [Chthoniobacteraceae bacterium]
MLTSAFAAEPVEVKIGVLPGLKFDVQRFAVAPGGEVKIVLRNPDQMIHNLVITKPGARMEVVLAALALGADGPAKNFVPDSPKVLFHTRALNPGETQELKFNAPKEEGVYPYVCTFTGHGVVMYGAMYVTTKPLPPLEGDPNLPPAAPAIADASDHSHHALDKPVVSRTFLPDCGPAAIAVGLPGGQSYCFDAGLCRLRYAWRGGFVDNTEHWNGKGEAMGKVVGRIYYRAPDFAPVRIGNNDQPAMRWRGYQMRDGYPQLEYTVDGALVRETAHAPAGGSGLEFTYEIEAGEQPVSYVTNPEGGASFTSSAGQWEKGVLTLTPVEAKHFTLKLTERPGVEPLLYWSMNDLVFANKKDPAPGVVGRAFTPGGTDGKPKGVLDTGVRLTDLVKTGGTVMLWWRATGDQVEAPIFSVGGGSIYGFTGPKGYDSEWQHLVFTLSEQGIQTFSVGLADSPERKSLTSGLPEGTLCIGSAGDKSFLKGLIDEVRIYDRVLPPAEIKAIYDREAAHLSENQRPVRAGQIKVH